MNLKKEYAKYANEQWKTKYKIKGFSYREMVAHDQFKEGWVERKNAPKKEEEEEIRDEKVDMPKKVFLKSHSTAKTIQQIFYQEVLQDTFYKQMLESKGYNIDPQLYSNSTIKSLFDLINTHKKNVVCNSLLFEIPLYTTTYHIRNQSSRNVFNRNEPILDSFRKTYLQARPIKLKSKHTDYDFYHLNTNNHDRLYSKVMEVAEYLTKTQSKSHISIFTDQNIGSTLQDFYKTFPLIKFVNNASIKTTSTNPHILFSYLKGEPLNISQDSDTSMFNASNIDSILGNKKLHFTINYTDQNFNEGDFVLYDSEKHRQLNGIYTLGRKKADNKWEIILNNKSHIIGTGNLHILEAGYSKKTDPALYREIHVSQIGSTYTYSEIIELWNADVPDHEVIPSTSFSLSKPQDTIEMQLSKYLSLFNLTDITYRGRVSNNQNWYVIRIN